MIDHATIFRRRMKEARVARDLSQEAAGADMKWDRSQWAHYELGTKRPTFYSLIKIADALNVSLDWLVGRKEYGGPKP